MPATKNEVAVVTGAGTGIGRATALALARSGRNVVLAGRRTEKLKEVEALIASETKGAAQTLIVPTDVADPDQVKALIDSTMVTFGRLDILINNAGRGDLLPIDKTNLETIRGAFETNAIGPALAIHLVWPIFTAQKSGCIVNVSTAGTNDPFQGFFAYAASKAAVNLMAKSCAKEGKWINVRAFAVAPGAVETSMLRSIFDQETLPNEICMEPEQIADVIMACIKGDRDKHNGRTIFVLREGDRVVETVA